MQSWYLLNSSFHENVVVAVISGLLNATRLGGHVRFVCVVGFIRGSRLLR